MWPVAVAVQDAVLKVLPGREPRTYDQQFQKSNQDTIQFIMVSSEALMKAGCKKGCNERTCGSN